MGVNVDITCSGAMWNMSSEFLYYYLGFLSLHITSSLFKAAWHKEQVFLVYPYEQARSLINLCIECNKCMVSKGILGVVSAMSFP